LTKVWASNGLGDSEKRKLGANWLPSLSPFAPTSRTIAPTPPAALRTPGTERTRLSTDAENGGISPLSCSTTFREVTTTSVPAYAVEKMSSKERLIVAVKAKVPHTSETPRTTAMARPSARSRRAESPRNV